MQLLDTSTIITTYIAKGLNCGLFVKCEIDDCKDTHALIYDPASGKISFQTSHTSEFHIICVPKQK